MIVVEVLTAMLVVSLAFLVTVALWVGLLGAVGAARMVRCDRCGRLGLSSSSEPLATCVRCRHEHLLHPVLAIQHTHGSHLSRWTNSTRAQDQPTSTSRSTAAAE